MKMKHTLILFFILFTGFYFSQNKTEIYVIGNIHNSVPNYHPKILFDILNKIQPDIILHEVDAQGMKEYETDKSLKGNEITASNLYLKKFSGTLRLPFDFENRNQYRKDKGMVPADNLSVKLIDSLYKVKKLSQAETKLYEGFQNTTKELMKIAELPPKQFNNKTTDKISERRQNAQYSDLTKITDNRKEFAERFVTKLDGKKISYREGFKLMSGFWDLRNQTMAQNIYNTAVKYPHKKIVVLTGFLHRYYLLKELNRLNKGNYVVKEFYE